MAKDKQMVKPPTGVITHALWVEQRAVRLWNAIVRYEDAGLEPDKKWKAELQTHIVMLRDCMSVKTWREIGFDVVETEIFK